VLSSYLSYFCTQHFLFCAKCNWYGHYLHRLIVDKTAHFCERHFTHCITGGFVVYVIQLQCYCMLYAIPMLLRCMIYVSVVTFRILPSCTIRILLQLPRICGYIPLKEFFTHQCKQKIPIKTLTTWVYFSQKQ